MLDRRYYYPCVQQVVPGDDYQVYAYFNDGSVRLFDTKPLIRPGTVFEPLSDKDLFKSKLTVINDTVAWDMGGGRDPYRCVDIDPGAVYAAPPVPDPLAD